MARIYDNIDMSFTQGLRDLITNLGVKRVDFCVGYFNLRGWQLVENEIDLLPGDIIYEGDESVFRTCRLLVGMQQPPEELLSEMYSSEEIIRDSDFVLRQKARIAEDFKKQLLIGIPTHQQEKTLRHLSQQLKEQKVCVKLYLKEPLHAKLYLAHRPEDRYNPIPSIMGSSNLTYAGLTREGELNAEFSDSDSAEKLYNWFEDRWEDRFCLDITDMLIEAIDNSWASEKEIPPYYIYLKTAYHLSQDVREGVSGYQLPAEFKGKLFDFQETAVKMVAKKLSDDKKGGAMIGDVVGLGKTITACAIAKIYELSYAARTLIICPANLQDMWESYIKEYDLKADVQSVAQHIDIEDSKYYKFIIIDESHNLRNSEGKRYRNIKALIEHLGSKVLLLTATPYNKDFRDIANQLRLFVSEDQDLGIRPEELIRTLGGEMQFELEYGDISPRSIKAFEKSNSIEDWNELMKLFLVRRTRTFIKQNYAKTDDNSGRKYLLLNNGACSYFPTRLPKAIKFKTEEGDQYTRMYSEQVLDLMEDLTLPRYGLSQYLDESKIGHLSVQEQTIKDNLSRAGKRLMGFCKSTFFKRMDSSGYSYILTVYRHILRNAIFLYAIDENLPFPIGDDTTLQENFSDEEDVNTQMVENCEEDVQSLPTDLAAYIEKAKEYYSLLQRKGNVGWLSSSYFNEDLRRHLLDDCKNLLEILSICGVWSPAEDQKLSELENLLKNEHKADKVIVFTQYSDTANYIYTQLKKRGLDYVGCVTGDCKNPTLMATRFSPVSNGEEITKENQYRVLIATDVLSEGQNLQDSHVIINFDLPWAIIRLIQRAGRVDRIGQKSEDIYCYSFFPADGVESLINLRGRLNTRINENADIVGSDEIFFEGNEQNLRDMFNEKSGSLDDDNDLDVDLSSKAYQIWKNATEANPELKKIIPNLSDTIYSTKVSEDAGVITYAKTRGDFDVLTWCDSEGKILTQSQTKILQAMSCSIDEPTASPLENHLDLVGKSIKTLSNERKSTGGMLGKKTSVKYRVYNLLDKYLQGSLSTEENTMPQDRLTQVKLAMDDIYNIPMLESSKYILNQVLKSSSVEEVVDTVLEMRKGGNLCKVTDGITLLRKQASIICSMGLKKETL